MEEKKLIVPQDVYNRIEADALAWSENQYGHDDINKDYLEGALHEAMIAQAAYVRLSQRGAVWVKASNYDLSKGGMLFYRFNGPNLKSIGIGHFVGDMFHGVNLDVFPKWDWKNLFILDESGTPAAGRGEDAVEFAEWAGWDWRRVEGKSMWENQKTLEVLSSAKLYEKFKTETGR